MRADPARRLRSAGKALVALACALAPGVAAAAGNGAADPVLEYRPVDLDPDGFRGLGRTSILAGSVEFRARPVDPDRYELRELVLASDALLPSGGEDVLCRGGPVWDGPCVVDFGPVARGLHLTARMRVRDRDTDTPRWIVRDVRTLRASADDATGTGLGLVETSSAESTPYDLVTRDVLVSRRERSGGVDRRVPVRGLTPDDFVVKAAGIGEVEVLSVRQPGSDEDCLVPVVWNVTACLSRRGGPAWNDEHASMIERIRSGLRSAAREGFSCEVLLVEYPATERPAFGPFRLFAGADLTDRQRDENERVLEALARHLEEEPLLQWGGMSASPGSSGWPAGFPSVYRTLNDLMRGYPARRRLLLLTDDAREPPRIEPTFLEWLWPARIAEINRAWPPERLSRFLHDLDMGSSVRDRKLEEILATLMPEDPNAAAVVASHLARSDPGGISSLQPHTADVWPGLDVLALADAPAPANFLEPGAILHEFGGRLWSWADRRDPEISGASRTLSEALLAVEKRIRDAYLVRVSVPNRAQDRQSHRLGFRLRGGRRDLRGVELEYMPTYSSSPPVSSKMPVFVASPFKVLRLLAAYELREHPFDDRYQYLLTERFSHEGDDQVRALLLESWISVQLQRLQADAEQVPKDRRRVEYVRSAYENLTGSVADEFTLAKRFAVYYRDRRPDAFR